MFVSLDRFCMVCALSELILMVCIFHSEAKFSIYSTLASISITVWSFVIWNAWNPRQGQVRNCSRFVKSGIWKEKKKSWAKIFRKSPWIGKEWALEIIRQMSAGPDLWFYNAICIKNKLFQGFHCDYALWSKIAYRRVTNTFLLLVTNRPFQF